MHQLAGGSVVIDNEDAGRSFGGGCFGLEWLGVGYRHSYAAGGE
jgi:hypothetical protein